MKGSEPEIQNYRKSKRSRRKTECAVIRSRRGCGICGSENVMVHGVRFCELCGAETCFLGLYEPYFFGSGVEVDCDCLYEYSYKGRVRSYRKISARSVAECMDCGAVRSRFCPNCKIIPYCWQSVEGQKYCQRCGYRAGAKK